MSGKQGRGGSTEAAGSRETQDLAGLRVTMSNALTRAGHGLSLAEKRIVMAAVAQLDSRAPYRPGEIVRTRVTAAQYAETYGVEPHTAYEALAEAAERLYRRSITFYEPVHTRGRKTAGATVVHMRWVGEARYQQGEGWIELAWWPPVLQHLIGLRRQFTTYQLQQASALRSIYSWRLLELLTKYESTGFAEYDITDLAISMDAPPSIRKDFGQMRRRILEPSIKELVEKDGWQITMSAVRQGRRVTAVRLLFRRDPQGRLF